jgi:hypothetical protein
VIALRGKHGITSTMRFGDQESVQSDIIDFAPRNRARQLWRIITSFAASILVMLLFNLVPGFVGVEPEASLLSTAIIAALCFYIVYQKQLSLDLVTATEFQNLLFAQAASAGVDFCLFFKRDGTVVYVHESFYTCFPSLRHVHPQTLDNMLDSLHVSAAEKSQLIDALLQDAPSYHAVAFNTAMFNVSIDPLTRPSGYVVFRANQANEQVQPHA